MSDTEGARTSYKRRRVQRTPSPELKLDDDDYQPYIPVAQRKQAKLAKLTSWGAKAEKSKPNEKQEEEDDKDDEEREEEYLSVLGLDCCLARVGVMGLTLEWMVVRASRKGSEPV